MEELARLKTKYKEKVGIYKQKFVDFRKKFNDSERELGFLRKNLEDEQMNWRGKLNSNEEKIRDIQEEYESRLTKAQEQSYKTIVTKELSLVYKHSYEKINQIRLLT